MMKKIMSVLLCAVFLFSMAAAAVPVHALGERFSESYMTGRYYDALLRTSLGSNERENILTVALSQLGYHEGKSMGGLHGENTDDGYGFTEYNYFCGATDDGSCAYSWNTSFISWCAAQCNISSFPVEIHSTNLANKFIETGVYHSASSGYVPKSGDIIFFNIDGVLRLSDRAGIVRYTAGRKVYVIEGESGKEVSLTSYNLDDSRIVGFASPAYKNDAVPQSRYNVTASALIIRSGPGTGYSRLGLVNENSLITVESISDGWAKMSYNGISGYVSCDWIEPYSSGHSHSYLSAYIPPEGCVWEGCTVHECSCGAGYADAYIPPAGHDYVSVVTEPSCTSEGYTVNTCRRCGDEYISNNTAPSGHRYADYVTESGCVMGGYTSHVCSICGYTSVDGYTEPSGHQWGEWYETAATGTLRRDCINCSSYELDTVSDKKSMNLTVGEVSGDVSRVVSVPILLSNNPGVWGMAFDISFDESILSFVEITSGDIFAEPPFYNTANGKCRVILENGNLNPTSGDGDVMYIQFKVLSAEKTDIILTFDPDNMIDENGESIDVSVTQGSVTGLPLLKGDLNHDGRLAPNDVTILKRLLSGKLTMSDVIAADLNGDGKIKPNDATILKRTISGKIEKQYITSVNP